MPERETAAIWEGDFRWKDASRRAWGKVVSAVWSKFFVVCRESVPDQDEIRRYVDGVEKATRVIASVGDGVTRVWDSGGILKGFGGMPVVLEDV